MNSFQKFLQWLVASSKDPGKFSLFIKGLAAFVIPLIVALANLTHLALPGPEAITIAFDSLSLVVYYILGAISLVAMAWGGVRKIWTTLNGTNAVIVMQQSNQE